MKQRGTYAIHLSHAQACIARDMWQRQWSVAEIAHYLSVDPSRVYTGRADELDREAANEIAG